MHSCIKTPNGILVIGIFILLDGISAPSVLLLVLLADFTGRKASQPVFFQLPDYRGLIHL